MKLPFLDRTPGTEAATYAEAQALLDDGLDRDLVLSLFPNDRSSSRRATTSKRPSRRSSLVPAAVRPNRSIPLYPPTTSAPRSPASASRPWER